MRQALHLSVGEQRLAYPPTEELTLMADRDLNGRTLGQYTLRELIGEGGYGAVYRGEEPVLEREVVVKVLHERRSDSESRERFLREAKLAAQLDHPYAAHVYAFGTEDEGRLPWIAMERVRGVPLDLWLDKHGPMSPEQFGPFFEGVCEVIHVAHKQGIIHRDLKPSNIMVVECEGRPLPKLIDFGIAKWHRHPEAAPDSGSDEDRDPDRDAVKTERLPVRPRRAGRTVACYDSESRRQLTPPGGCLGSPPYMALEQWVGADAVGPEADIYALAIIAYEMLTGRRLFVASRTAEYLEQHKRASVPPLGDGFPPALDQVIQCALDKDPQVRPGTALELASDLRGALRKIKREQLRASAQQWSDQAAAPGLLWGADVLEDALRSVPQQTLGPLERSFVAESQRRIRRIRWVRRALVSLAAATAVGWFLYRAAMQARADRRVMEATIAQSELEQGRSALLHGEPEAQIHLGRAYRRGDHSPSTAFMLARALQPRLAEQARLASTFGRMWSAAFSPDGRQIVTTDDKAAQVWDAQTGKRSFTLPYDGTVYEAVYSPDGARLVVAGGVGTVRIWNAASGALVRELRRNDTGPRYYAVAMSPDGMLVAAIGTRGDVANVWDATTGEPVAEIRNDASEFPAIAFSADGRWLATTGGDDVRIFDVQARRQAVTIRGPRIRSLAFDPTGPRLLTGAATGDVAIWSVLSGARIQHLRDVRDPVGAVAFSPDGRLVAAGSVDGAIQIWRTESGELQSQLNPRHSNITAIEFDRASRLVLAAGGDGAVIVADASLGMPVTVLEGPQSVRVAHFDPRSRRVVGASLDGAAWVWDATSPYRRWGIPPVADGCGLGPSPEPDRRFIAAGCRDRATRVWDTARDQLLAELPSATPVGGNFLSASPAVSSAGDRAAIVRGGAVDIYGLPGGQLLSSIAHGAPVSAVAFATTGRDVVSGATDGSLLVTRDGGAQVTLPAALGGVDAVGFLPDGRMVAAYVQRRLRVYDRGGAILADLEIPARVMSLRIEGTRLVTVPIPPSYSGNATSPILLDLERYQIIAQLEGHVGRVFSARWVAGGQILTAGADGAARLWDGATGQLRQVYQGRSRNLTDATLAPDGLVMAGGADGSLQFWDRDGGRLLWVLRAHAAPIIGIHVEGSDIVTRGFTGELARWTLPSPGQVIGACGAQERCAIVL
jgi:WD40 repeat protein/serine/threonine protein kinase